MAQLENKKRKRQSNGSDTPNKKLAQEITNNRSITVQHLTKTGPHPVLVSAPGLEAPTVSFKAYAKARSNRSPDKSAPTPSSHDLLLHSSQHPRLDYTASSISLDQHLSHYVGVFDPLTLQLQLIPAHHLSLRTTLRSAKKEDEKKQRRTIGQQREELGREFGTKKAKKAIAARTINAIDRGGKPGKDGAQDAILADMADVAAPLLDEKEHLKAALATKPIPQPHLDAETVEEVYPFNTLIPASDARFVPIKHWQEEIEAKGDEWKHKYSFVEKRAPGICKAGNILRLKALGYLSLLLDWHYILQNAGRAGKKVPKKDFILNRLAHWPETLVDNVRRRFANSHNELTKWHMDNLYTHICALSLYVDGWTTNTTNLKIDLRMDNKTITQYYRELGCKISAPTDKEKEVYKLSKAAAAATKIAKLKLPPDFPKLRIARRR